MPVIQISILKQIFKRKPYGQLWANIPLEFIDEILPGNFYFVAPNPQAPQAFQLSQGSKFLSATLSSVYSSETILPIVVSETILPTSGQFSNVAFSKF